MRIDISIIDKEGLKNLLSRDLKNGSFVVFL